MLTFALVGALAATGCVTPKQEPREIEVPTIPFVPSAVCGNLTLSVASVDNAWHIAAVVRACDSEPLLLDAAACAPPGGVVHLALRNETTSEPMPDPTLEGAEPECDAASSKITLRPDTEARFALVWNVTSTECDACDRTRTLDAWAQSGRSIITATATLPPEHAQEGST